VRQRTDSRITKRLTVILCPPVKVAPADNIVKDKADEYPGHIVKRGGRGHEVRATEDDWEIDVLEEICSELLVQYPLKQGCKDTGKEEEDEAIVELTVRK
jgi:hypothetical protein